MEYSKNRNIKVYAIGVFDVFHVGHLNYLECAANQKIALSEAGKKGWLIVGIQDDRSVAASKSTKLVNKLRERLAIVRALRCVDEVISYRDVDQSKLLAALGIDILVVSEQYGSQTGYDCDTVDEQLKTLAYCGRHGVRVIRVPRTDGVSSTGIREKSKKFWLQRTKQHAAANPAGVTVLGSFKGDQELARNATEREIGLIINLLGKPLETQSFIERGCGDGRLFAPLSKFFKKNVGVEYCGELIELCRKRLQESQSICEVINADVVSFKYESVFDVALCSGVLQYLDDRDAEMFVDNIVAHLKKAEGSRFVLREPCSTELGKRIEIIDQFSPDLGGLYSSIYRSFDQVEDLFVSRGFLILAKEKIFQHHVDTAMYLYCFKLG